MRRDDLFGRDIGGRSRKIASRRMFAPPEAGDEPSELVRLVSGGARQSPRRGASGQRVRVRFGQLDQAPRPLTTL